MSPATPGPPVTAMASTSAKRNPAASKALRVVGTSAANTVAVTLGATGITALSGITSIVNVETITRNSPAMLKKIKKK